MKAKPIYAFLFFALVIVCYRLLGYSGHFGYDDMQYAEIAANLLNGNIDFDDHFTFRFTIIAATALSYLLFGINDLASSLPAMVLTILTLLVVYAALHKKGFWPTALGLALTTTSQFFLFYSNKLMPDIYLAFFTLLAVYIYYRNRYESEKHTILHAMVFSLSLLFGFMSKGTVVLLTPWLLYLFVTDFLKKRGGKFWKWAIFLGTVYLIVYFVVINILTGDFLYRFKAIAENSYLNKCSYDQQPMGILLRRLYHDFFDMSITSGIAVTMVCVVVAIFFRRSYFTISAILLFLSSNFMTISATSYIPMCIDPRHYLFLVPVAAIATAFFIAEKPSRMQVYIIAGVLLLLTIYAFFGNRDICYWIYLPITLVTIVAAILQGNPIPIQYLYGALLLAMMAWPIKQMFGPSYEYNERRDLLIDHVINDKENVLVVSDEISTRMMRYYDGFSSNDRYISFNNLSERAENNIQGRIALVLNYHTLALDGLTYEDLPHFAYTAYSKQPPELDKYGVKLYHLDEYNLILEQHEIIYSSTNHFDGNMVDYWRDSTFIYPLDSLHSAGRDTVFIHISAQCKCYTPTNCIAVVSIEKEGNNLSWNSSSIENNMRAYSHWYSFEYRKELHLNEFPTGSLVYVYFYKTDKSSISIDDFSISFCKINS